MIGHIIAMLIIWQLFCDNAIVGHVVVLILSIVFSSSIIWII